MESTKPKVSTHITLPASEKKEKVIRVVKDYPKGLTPKEIVKFTHLNHNTVKSIVCKLKREGKVKLVDESKGSYALVENDSHGVFFDWKFHNTYFSAELPYYEGEYIEENRECGDITLEFKIGKESKQATAHLITDNPLPMNTLMVCCMLFKECIKSKAGVTIPDKDIKVTSIEFNQTYEDLRLDGLKCLTLDSLLSQYKIYQRREGVRIEHKIKGELSWESISILLSGQSNNLYLCEELVQLKKSVERDLKKLSQGFLLILNLLDRLDKKDAW